MARSELTPETVLERFRLDGRVALVTGASGGMGAGFARALGEAGATVVIAARRTEQLHNVRDDLAAQGISCLAVSADVSDPESAKRLVHTTIDELGHLDVLINNAGVTSSVPATREEPDQFRRIIDINLHGAYWVAQACAQVMRPGSAIVNVSSVLALVKSELPQAAYSASKAGLLGLTRDLSAQWAGRRGIRVNALAPGFVATEMLDEMADSVLDKFVATSTLGRLGTQREVDAAMLFLASPAASYVTGATLAVDGGMSGH